MESIESSYSRPFGMAAVRPDVPRFTTECGADHPCPQ